MTIRRTAALLCPLILAACAHTPASKPEAAHWANARQLVLVTTADWDAPTGILRYFERAGDGWKQVNAELAFERSGPERIYSSIVLLEPWIALLRKSPQSTGVHLDTAGRAATPLAALRNMSIAVTARPARGERPVVAAALRQASVMRGPMRRDAIRE